MHENIQKRPKLLIVSDTAMLLNDTNVFEAFEPVVREIENFEYLFDSIVWIGYNYYGANHGKNMRATNTKIKFIILERTGGSKLLDKLKIVTKMFPYFFIILKHILKSDVVHTRAPSMPAFLAICISFLDKKRVYWHKYAGNWNEENPPKFYALQRTLLKKVKHTHVTINGSWPKQQKHLLSFENPCLTDKEIIWISKHAKNKDFKSKINFCFIGNINEAKGVKRIIEAFFKLDLSCIGTIHFIGDGKERYEYESMAKGLPIVFHGFMLRDQMHDILNKCHFLLLPSKSEGFPKVIAETSPYGIIPIVSSVSSIPQYINDCNNGFLIPEVTSKALEKVLHYIMQLDKKKLEEISNNSKKLYKIFSYEYYNKRIKEEIIDHEF